MKHLAHLTVVRMGRKTRPGLPRLHGWVYDLGTGIIKVVCETHSAAVEPPDDDPPGWQ